MYTLIMPLLITSIGNKTAVVPQAGADPIVFDQTYITDKH